MPLLALPLLLGTAAAASWDPELKWRVFDTEHFRITFHDGEEALAREMAEAAEEAWTMLVPEIGTRPRERVKITLVDWTDSANGYASVYPHDSIVIFVTQPGGDTALGMYEDWNEAIVVHELTHILHMDTVRGLPAVGRAVFGSIISTHQLAPAWTIEGYATLQETRHSLGGRGRSPLVDMVKRSAVLEGKVPPIDTLDGYQALPPSGNLRYVFGQDFMQFVADRTGSEKWEEWVRRYGASLPFFLPARRTFGKSLVALWKEWKIALQDRYGQQLREVEALGLTQPTILSPEGQSCGAPAFRPDGEALAWSCYDHRRGGSIWQGDAEGLQARVLVRDKYVGDLAWRPDGRAFAYASIGSSDLYHATSDIWLHDLDTRRSKQLTSGKRADHPSFSADGSRLLVSTNALQQEQLAVLTIDQRLRPLTELHQKESLADPAYSPDGSRIVVALGRDGYRDLWLLDAEGEPLRRLTQDVAADLHPTWSADGRWIYFASDRTGIPNIFAIDLVEDHLWQVTNVATGATNPSLRADGKKIAFNLFSTLGNRVAVMDLDPRRFRDRGSLGFGARTLPPSPPPAPPAELPPLATRPYNPLPTLFPPTFWVPGALLTTTGDGYGAYLSAWTGGSDTLSHLSWGAYLTFRTDAAFLGGGGSLVINRWRPVFSAGMSTYVSPYGDVYTWIRPDDGGPTIPGIEDADTRYWDHRIRGYAAMGWPLSTKASLYVLLKGESRQPLDPLPDDVYVAALPTRGWFSSISAGWSYAKGESYPLSISTEEGRVLAFGLEYSPGWAGSWTYDDAGVAQPFDQLQATGEWREYVKNPWVPNHVLATRLNLGATLGDAFAYGSFRLGGYWSEGGITVVPEEWRPLRGYYAASDSGEWFWLGSAEYRFPLFRVDRGVGTLPVFLRHFSGAVFVDAGNAVDEISEMDVQSTLVGVGAELRASVILGYGMGLYGRLGYAFGTQGEGAIPVGDPYGFYATLGTSF